MKKKIFSSFATLLIFVMLLFSLVGCKNDDPDYNKQEETTISDISVIDVTTAEETVKETQKESEKESQKETKKEKETKEQKTEPETEPFWGVEEDGEYTSKEEVAEYIYLYGHLPSNYITKSEAEDLGWKSKGNLDKVAPGKSIGGDKFGNREGLLPKAKGRQYYECDIDYKKGSRNAKRIIYSNDGLIFYTEDHYESFELLYGEE